MRNDVRHQMPTLPKWSKALLLIATLTSSGCEDKINNPGKVIVTKDGKISGYFTIVDVPHNSGGIQSDGSGGACLLVRLADVGLGFGCRADSRNSAVDRTCPDMTGVWATYCDIPDGAPDGTTGECYGRALLPAGQNQTAIDVNWCNRSPDYTPNITWPIGAPQPVNKSTELDPATVHGLQHPSRWRIQACIKKDANSPPNCHMGQVWTLP